MLLPLAAVTTMLRFVTRWSAERGSAGGGATARRQPMLLDYDLGLDVSKTAAREHRRHS